MPGRAKKDCTLLWLFLAILLIDNTRGCLGFQHRLHSYQRPPKLSSSEDVQRSRVSNSRHNHLRVSSPLLLASRGNDDDNNKSSRNNILGDEERRKGILVLLTVPFAWGTFEPVVRFVYAIEPPIPGLVFSPFYYFVAATALSLLSTFSSRSNRVPDVLNIEEDNLDNNDSMTVDYDETFSSNPSVLGGIELGTYLFLGNSLQVLGLNTLNSDRVAFLIQLTTIFVPLVQAIAARSLSTIPLRVWFASLIALGGVGVISFEGKEDALLQGADISDMISSQSLLSQGDVLVIGAALCYTFHCIRLEPIAKQTRAVSLAAMKATTETVLSILLVLGLLLYRDISGTSAASSTNNFLVKFALESAEDISNFFTTIGQRLPEGSIPSSVLLPALGACLWTGLITCGYTIYAQSFGQSRVNPSDANLIYTFQPVWTSLIAFFLLGETLGPTGFLGGCLIGLAVYLVITSSEEQGQPPGGALEQSEGAYLQETNETKEKELLKRR